MAPKTSASSSSPPTHYFTCAVVGETITECDTLIKAIVGKKFFASKSTFGCSEGELDAIRDGLKAMSRDGLLGGNDSISSVTLSAEDDPTGATLVNEVSAVGKKPTKDSKGGDKAVASEPTQKLQGRCAEFRFIHVLDPQQLVSMTPPPSAVIMCYTPVEPSTLTALAKKWVPSVAQMLKRPELLVVATRVESLASKKGIEWLKTQGVPKTPCEEAIDKASSWRAVDYVEVSAACYINIELLLKILAKACFIIPSKRVTPEIAEAMRKDCIQPIVSTQSKWSWKRTDRRRLYFYNRITRTSQWTRPPDYDGEEPEMTEAEKEAEAKAKRTEIEKRMRDDHEKLLEEQFRNEAAMHSEKMEEMEKQSVGLSQQVNTLTIQMEEIRRLIAVNKRDREELERLKEGIEETRFSKSSVDDDTRVERDIADARARVFELESRAAMNEEKQNYSIEIAELVLSNDLQAQTLRKLLQSQVDVRKQGAATQSKAAALTAHMDTINGQIAAISQEIPKANHMLSAKLAELRRTKKSLQELQAEKAALSSSIEDSDGLEYSRQVNIEKLIHQSKMLDVEIDKKRLEKGLINMAAAAAGGGLDVTGGRFPSSQSPVRHNSTSHHDGDLEASQRSGGRLKPTTPGGGGSAAVKGSAHQHQQRSEAQKAAESALREEESRLHLEEKSLASQLAIAAAESALREIALRQKSHLLEYSLSEHSFSSEKYLRIYADLVDTLARIRDNVCSGSYFAVSNPFELDMLAATIEDVMADTSHHSTGGYHSSSSKRRPGTSTSISATSGLGVSSPTAAASTSTNSILKGGGNNARATTPGGTVRPSRTTMSARPSQSSLKKHDSKLGGSFGKNASFGESAVSSGAGGGGGRNNAITEAQQMATLTKNDMRLMRSAVGVEKQRGDLAATVRAKCKVVEQNYSSTKSTIETQRIRTLTHMRDALKSMSEIEVLAGHERSSPLDRFVTLLEDSFVGNSNGNRNKTKRGSFSTTTTIATGGGGGASSSSVNNIQDGGELPAIVSEIIDGFTARMLQSVPANERSRLAMQVNSVFAAGASHLNDMDHQSNSLSTTDNNNNHSSNTTNGGATTGASQSTRTLINNAILTSPQGATKAALYGPGSLKDVESQYRTKEHQTTALTNQYNDAARRAASSLGIDLDGPNANQRDSLARAKMKVFSTPPSQLR